MLKWKFTLNISWQLLIGKTIYIIDERNKATFTLENVGAYFWILVERGLGFQEIVKEIGVRYSTPEESVTRDILKLAEEMETKGFIERVGMEFE